MGVLKINTTVPLIVIHVDVVMVMITRTTIIIIIRSLANYLNINIVDIFIL